MPRISDPLARTRPLADPLRAFTWLLVVLAVVAAVTLYPAFAAVGVPCTLLALALLIAPSGRPNAMYLRAFRTDSSTAGLRAQLAAILGPRFRLTGIRPPGKKLPVFVRFVLPFLFVLRYMGSKFMDLEAGDDWMARLWKTYQKTRVVFIDVRDITRYVHQEIQLTVRSMGLERCIFVIGPDPSNPFSVTRPAPSEQEWRQIVAEIAGPEADPAKFKLLDAGSPTLRADLESMIAALPPGAAGASDAGREYVLEHVSEEQLKKSRRPSPATVLTTVVALAIYPGGPAFLSLLPHGLAMSYFHFYQFMGGKVTGSLALAVVALALSRGTARVWRLLRCGHRGYAARGALVLAAAIALYAGGYEIPYWLSARANPEMAELFSAQGLNEAAATDTLRAIADAEIAYLNQHRDKGFECSLPALAGETTAGEEQPTERVAEAEQTPPADPGTGNAGSSPPPPAASAPLPDPATGLVSGYVFRVAQCNSPRYQAYVASHKRRQMDSFDGDPDAIPALEVTAEPQAPGKSGHKGFCLQMRGPAAAASLLGNDLPAARLGLFLRHTSRIAADPKGGTDCTEPEENDLSRQF